MCIWYQLQHYIHKSLSPPDSCLSYMFKLMLANRGNKSQKNLANSWFHVKFINSFPLSFGQIPNFLEWLTHWKWTVSVTCKPHLFPSLCSYCVLGLQVFRGLGIATSSDSLYTSVSNVSCAQLCCHSFSHASGISLIWFFHGDCPWFPDLGFTVYSPYNTKYLSF